MEEEKLLLALVTIVLSFSIANSSYASNLDEQGYQLPKESDYGLAREILKMSKKKVLPHLMQSSDNNRNHSPSGAESSESGFSESEFYIFVSFSLDKQNLHQLMELAKKYQATLVLRGLKNNSFKQTASFLQELKIKEDSPGFSIDPILFQTYEVTEVPSYVLVRERTCPPDQSCKKIYDKITGNITARFALENFSKAGDLQSEASQLLSGWGEK